MRSALRTSWNRPGLHDSRMTRIPIPPSIGERQWIEHARGVLAEMGSTERRGHSGMAASLVELAELMEAFLLLP